MTRARVAGPTESARVIVGAEHVLQPVGPLLVDRQEVHVDNDGKANGLKALRRCDDASDQRTGAVVAGPEQWRRRRS